MRIASVLSLLVPTMIGCTRQDTLLPISTATAVGNYRLEGRLVSCRAYATSDVHTSAFMDDSTEELSIQLTDSTQGRSNPTVLVLGFYRSASQSTAPYQFGQAVLYVGNGTKTIVVYDKAVATLQETSAGVFSGTFSDNEPGHLPLSEGSFTSVHVHDTYPE